MLFSALICACGEYKLEEETPKSTIRSHYSYSMKKGNASKKKPFPTNPLRIATICLRGNTP